MKKIASTIGLISCLTVPAASHAQGNARPFSASAVETTFLTVEDASPLPAQGYQFGLLTSFESQPLVFVAGGENTQDIVGNRLNLDTTFAYGILDWLEAGVAVPIVASQSGQKLDGTAAIDGFAVGDPALATKIRLVDVAESVVGVSTLLQGTVPVGSDETFNGEASPTGTLKLLLESRPGPTTVGLSLGYTIRSPFNLATLTVDDQLSLGLAANWKASKKLSVIAETNIATDAASPLADDALTPGDLNAGLRYRVAKRYDFTGGLGMGILPGYGAPTWRGFLGFQTTPISATPRRQRSASRTTASCPHGGQPNARGFCGESAGTQPTAGTQVVSQPGDHDGDEIIGLLDQCPYLPEDKDGFRDHDGCPDEDNDRDLIPDAIDQAPNLPEDWDTFEDTDGVPDPDNDRDGISDQRDRCPMEAGRGDGCPMTQAELADLDAARMAEGDGSTPLVIGQMIYPSRILRFEEKTLVLDESTEVVLDGLAQYLRSHPRLTRIELGVHVNGTANSDWARWLARHRAKALAEELTRRGVDEARLYPVGFGTDIIQNGMALETDNERVELRVLGRREPSPLAGSLEAPKSDNPYLTPETAAPAQELVDGAPVIRPSAAIKFVPRKEALKEQALPLIQELVEELNAAPEYTLVEVGVHTDGLGNQEWKKQLSQMRAEAVAAVLVESGVDANRITAMGYGAERRLAPDTSSAGRAKNRRVELRIIEIRPPQEGTP